MLSTDRKHMQNVISKSLFADAQMWPLGELCFYEVSVEIVFKKKTYFSCSLRNKILLPNGRDQWQPTDLQTLSPEFVINTKSFLSAHSGWQNNTIQNTTLKHDPSFKDINNLPA